MAERTNAMAAPRPLLRRMLSFREPLLVIPYLLSFLGAAASALARSHSSLLHSLARALFPAAPAAANAKHAPPPAAAAAAAAAPPPDGEDAALSKAEVEAIMATIGLAAAGKGEGLAAAMGRDEVSALFDADEPSFAEVRGAFAVFDADRDGFIGAEDLQCALARLGVRQDAAACRAMVVAAGGGRDARMSLFQFVRFLENGLC
uniref:EF hand family protein n=1 Tax=Zea mays TaxID=4577 RepID=B6SSP2_MAIZE|nr:EF hand family protein [Zea mays]